MSNVVPLILIAAIVLYFVAFFRSRYNSKNIYIDGVGESKTFRNDEFGITAKPDRIREVKVNVVDVYEYKSRKSRIYESDVVQAIASAIAVKSKHRVRNITVENGAHQRKTFRYTSDKAMFKKIKRYYDLARMIKRGDYRVAQATPDKFKCGACAYNRVCEFAR